MRNSSIEPTLNQERSKMLQQWQDWLEIPMLVLSFTWLGLFIVELVWGLNPLLEASSDRFLKEQFLNSLEIDSGPVFYF